uniref:Luciferin 4-monooxygenase n=1 Tax=Timema monikensis TaxID=170555 RepID=A0A7R9HMN1_9NEOP|nr:unnamed protein product [Timema monikensis]
MPLRQVTEVAAPSFDGSSGDAEAGLASIEVGGGERLVQNGPDPLLVPRLALGRYLLQKLQLHGDKDFLIHAVTGERWTFSDVLRKSTSVAESLRALGLMTGEVVGMFTGNCMEFFLPILGAYYLGASIATFSPTSTVSELLHAMNISKPRIIFCSTDCVETLEKVVGQLPFLQTVVVLGATTSPRHVPFHSLIQHEPANFNSVDVDPEQHIAAILCSSGTTGLPKGVMLTATNVITCMEGLMSPVFGDLNASQTHLGVLPLFHSYGYLAQLASLSIGFTTILMPRFNEDLFLRSIQTYKVWTGPFKLVISYAISHYQSGLRPGLRHVPSVSRTGASKIRLLFIAPTLMVFLAKHPKVDLYDLRSVQEIWCGSAPLSPEVHKQVEKRLNVANIRQGYGMTETTMGVVNTPRGAVKYGSAGRLAPGTSAKVLDLKSGKPLGPNQKGELCFRSPLNMRGYCGNLKATLETVDDEGFVHSGDIGYYDEDCYFYIVDRVKELIKYKGHQVPPAEVESVLLKNPAIKDAAVVGLPDDLAGELPLAFVVRQPGSYISEGDIVKYVAEHISPPKRLHGGVRFIDAIPKTASGKILRRQLKTTFLTKSKL